MLSKDFTDERETQLQTGTIFIASDEAEPEAEPESEAADMVLKTSRATRMFRCAALLMAFVASVVCTV